MPALLHKTPTRPQRSMASAIICRTEVSSRTSVRANEAWPPWAEISFSRAGPRSLLKSAMRTVKPRAAKCRTIPRPIPYAPPETTATFPVCSFMRLPPQSSNCRPAGKTLRVLGKPGGGPGHSARCPGRGGELCTRRRRSSSCGRLYLIPSQTAALGACTSICI